MCSHKIAFQGKAASLKKIVFYIFYIFNRGFGHNVCQLKDMMIYSSSSQPGNHHQWWYVTQCHFCYKWFVALWKIHVFNLCTSSCSPPSSLCYWFAWHWNTGENKRKIEHWRVAPVFKRILRMGIPALIGRGGGRVLILGLVVAYIPNQDLALTSPAPKHHTKHHSEN